MRIASQSTLALSRWDLVRLSVYILALLLISTAKCSAAEFTELEGVSSRDARIQAIRSVPFGQLGANGEKIKDVVEKPSFYRRMPTRQISCDPQMFKFLVRRPEVMVNIWDAMGITRVSARRVSPFAFLADDGVGTTCRCDLIYGDNNLHIYYGDGAYDGTITPRKVTGRCVCILQSQAAQDATGHPVVSGTMDVFLKLDNLGADLVTRTLGPFVGKTADNNFVETARFIAQISQVCEHSVTAAYGLATKLDKVDPSVRREFVELATALARSASASVVPEHSMLRTEDHRLAEAIAAYGGSPAPSSTSAVSDPRSTSAHPEVSVNATDVGEGSSEPAWNSAASSRTNENLPAQKFEGSNPVPAITPHKPHVYMRR